MEAAGQALAGWRPEGWEPPAAPRAGVEEQLAGIRESLHALHRKADRIMTALDNLQAAETALKQEVVTLLADIAARLANTVDPAGVQAVADDITNTVIPELVAGDPGVVAPPAPTA